MTTGFVKTTDVNVGSDPQLAIRMVTAAGVSPTLAHAWSVDGTTYPRFPNFSDYADVRLTCALLMHGTIKELKEKLGQASRGGTEGFWSSGDALLVWYMNRKADWNPKTLVLVAPMQKFLNVTDENPLHTCGHDRGWRHLATSAKDGTANYQGLSLNWLRHDGLDKAAETAAWV